jgi:AcrR family transcriptional regulator
MATVDMVDTRTRLREAALDLFGRQGVAGTSTRTILKAADLRNPSAISYYFKSKAGLVEDLVAELRTEAWPVVRLQVELAENRDATLEEWTAVAADSAANLVSTERGCLMARILWEYDCVLSPNAFEEFLASGDPLALRWQDAIRRTFPHLPANVAVARNFLVVHTIEWLLARYAGRVLIGQPSPSLKVKHPGDVRPALYEVAMALFTGPSQFTDEDLVFE